MPTWTLPMPPAGVNHATQVSRDGHVYRTAESKAWEQGVRLITGGWEPPARTPLVATVELYFLPRKVWSCDADKWAATVLDAVVGKRHDNWLGAVTVVKSASADPRVVVRVETASDYLAAVGAQEG